MERCCGELNRIYTKKFNKKIELLCFSIIEAKYIHNAESSIAQYFKSNLINYKNYKELIVIDKKDINQIKQHYKMIQCSYIRYNEMYNKIQILEKEIIDLNNKLLMKDKDIEIIKKIHEKDIELLKYKIKNLENLSNN